MPIPMKPREPALSRDEVVAHLREHAEAMLKGAHFAPGEVVKVAVDKIGPYTAAHGVGAVLYCSQGDNGYAIVIAISETGQETPFNAPVAALSKL